MNDSAPTKVPLPIQEAVRDFFADLVGRATTVTKCPTIVLGVAVDQAGDAETPEPFRGEVAVYRDDSGRALAAAIADLELASASAAALSLVPAVMLEEVRQSGSMPETMFDNYCEIANVFSALLNSSTTPHLTLDVVLGIPAELPPDVAGLVAAPGRRRDFLVEIEGYGDGHLVVVSTPTG